MEAHASARRGCSIDAFAVGVSFAFMTLNIWLSVVIIGITTGLFSAAGLYIGRAFGSRWQKPRRSPAASC